MMREPAASVVDLGRLALLFGRTNRVTYHEDGLTPESDTDHTVMLGLVACSFAAMYEPDLDLGLIAQFAFVHDLVEAYAGDTNTLHILGDNAKADKAAREHAAFLRIEREFTEAFPWLPHTIAAYERRDTREARFVKAIDKFLPKVTHILNGLTTVRESGMTLDELALRYTYQAVEIAEYAGDFPSLETLRKQLVDAVFDAAIAPVTAAAGE
jgi:5'-deoxynucleotidase YfbR-like HD superfamily hydrolase